MSVSTLERQKSYSSTKSMRAMSSTVQGVEMIELPKLLPKDGEVRVRIIAAAVNAGEEKVIDGDFVGRFLHARTKPLVLGWDYAGVIDHLGGGVTDLEVGAEVWGHLQYSLKQSQGTFAEYITVRRDSLARKPPAVPFHVVAASSTVTQTALQSLRDLGRLKEGGSALIIGAAGGIGAVATGIAKRLGAHVTSVCSAKDVDRVALLGADVVIDRKRTDPLAVASSYDVIFDTPAVQSFTACANALKPGGAYVTTLPDFGLLAGLAHSFAGSKRCYFVQVASRQQDLELVGKWLDDGLKVPIDSRHKVSDLAVALKRQTEGSRTGRVVVDIEYGW